MRATSDDDRLLPKYNPSEPPEKGSETYSGSLPHTTGNLLARNSDAEQYFQSHSSEA